MAVFVVGVVMRMGMAVAVTVVMGVTVAVVMSVVVGVIVAVVMIMVGFQVHIKFDSGYAPLAAASRVQVIALHAQLSQFQFQLPGIDPKIDHGADEHIAADAAEKVQVKRLHECDSALRSATSALIWLAAYPAPNPLSIFTTVTPLPQLLSIPSSAAIPPKLAP